ncbi:hypothetical protein V1525DRAFT_411432 [Lipomyces kononenkoae]|uniref:Uncharacterized protein n=1 Tax=Lipomyces kononenkoae TaxID=34357 RepID=A0ACC3STI6_LIPKO
MTASVFDPSGASSHICCQAESFDDLDTTRRPQLDGLGGGVGLKRYGSNHDCNVRLTTKPVARSYQTCHQTEQHVADSLPPSKPDVSRLPVWGCKAWVLLPAERRKRSEKFKPRSKLGYYVGTEAHNIFRIWMPDANNVIRARDVTFIETGINTQRDPDQTEDNDYVIDFSNDQELERPMATNGGSNSIETDPTPITEDLSNDSSIIVAPPQRSSTIGQHRPATPEEPGNDSTITVAPPTLPHRSDLLGQHPRTSQPEDEIR